MPLAASTAADSAVPTATALPAETDLLRQRREEIFGADQPPSPPWALALSGGGIRSATFALGVLQAVAEAQPAAESPRNRAVASPAAAAATGGFRASLLSQFDYLSTVSGGGYVGAFMCSLFKPQRLRDASRTPQAAADDAVAVLAIGAPGRIHAAAYTPQNMLHAPLAWLRENGRYLVPNGVGDAVYAAALAVRGWIALHIVIGMLLVFLFSLLLRARAALPGTLEFQKALLERALPGPGHGVQLWWSPLFALSALPLLGAALPLGVAYWLCNRRHDGCSPPLNWSVAGMLGSAVPLLALAGNDIGRPTDWQALLASAAASPRSVVWAWLGITALLGVAIYVPYAAFLERSVAAQRARLTQWLGAALLATAGVLGLATIETAGQTLYLLVRSWVASTSPAAALTPAALLAAAVWLVKKAAALFGQSSAASPRVRLPLTALGGIAGVLLCAAIATLWSVAVVALVWSGTQPAPESLNDAGQVRFLGWLTLATLAIALLTGQFPAFINLSSLQAFYAARLTRAYLGASNGRRFTGDPQHRSVAEPLAGDTVELGHFYGLNDSKPSVAGAQARLTTWAPLHIINVTLNKTVDPAEQLVQRDRKGQPLAVLPYGFAVDGRLLPFAERADGTSEIKLPLNVGQWIGTSGAAFSTGIGRETSLGMSLLMGAANVRLGTWWDSGHGERTRASGIAWLGASIGALFRTQTYLSYEFRARFFGMNRRWQYLSDGGHFENTGLYELLRPERGVELVVACDCGADPEYRFDDLANLIRLARIDRLADVEVVPAASLPKSLQGLFGTPADFAGRPGRTGTKPPPCALLLKAVRPAGPPTWVLLMKPEVHRDAPADVQQYAAQHAQFPQEPTTDQFFDEAQWESYRALGHFIARRVLQPQVLTPLLDFIRGNAPAGRVAT